MRLIFAAALLSILGAAGCCGGNRQATAPRPTPTPPPPFVVTRIAVLPFENATASIDAPKVQRAALHARIKNKGYVPIPLAEVDRALDELGVQLAGQLQVTSHEELREKLKADVAISGKTLKANALMVEAEITVTDLRTKQVLKTARRTVEGSSSVGGKGLEGFAAAAAVAMATKLHEAHNRLADALMIDVPMCPREAPPPPPPPPSNTPAPVPT